jgi:hypothetical protein
VGQAARLCRGDPFLSQGQRQTIKSQRIAGLNYQV